MSLSDDAKLLWVFLLTCPSTPIPGVIIGGTLTLSERLEWLPERFAERFAELLTKQFAVDRDRHVLWLKNSLKYQRPANPNAVRCWAKAWDEMPEGRIKPLIWQPIKIACEKWKKLFGQLFKEPSPNGSPNGSPNNAPTVGRTMIATNTSTNTSTNTPDIALEQITADPKRSEIKRELLRAIPPATPVPAYVPGTWARLQAWWDFMREVQARIKATGISPEAPEPPRKAAGIHERNLHDCAKQFEQGYSADLVDEKMRHVVLIAEATATREKSLKWFIPSKIWDPESAARAADTSVQDALTGGKPVEPKPFVFRLPWREGDPVEDDEPVMAVKS